jgi:hypothetical protein
VKTDLSPLSGIPCVNPRALERARGKPNGLADQTATKLKIKFKSGRPRAHDHMTPEQAVGILADWNQ